MSSIRYFHAVAATLLAFAIPLPGSAAAAQQPSGRFGDAIVFTPSTYTPQGVASLLFSPLPSQDRSRFGEAIVFAPSAYTPQGITSLAYSPLPSQDRSRFGATIVFAPSAYTPQGIARRHVLDTALAP